MQGSPYIPPWSKEQKAPYPQKIVLDVAGYMKKNHLVKFEITAFMKWLAVQKMTEVQLTFPNASRVPVVHAMAPRPLSSNILQLFFDRFNI